MKRGRRRSRVLPLLLFLPVVALAAALLLLLPPVQESAPVFVRGSIDADRVTFAAQAFADPSVRGFCLVFEPAASNRGSAKALLVVEGGGGAATFGITIPGTATRVCVPCPGLTTFQPEAFRLSWEAGAPARALAGVEPLVVGPGAPIPADLGVVLAFEPPLWRQADYEVFRWSSVPSVVIFDTASYEVQDRLFKRLAFFVEKKGYVGTIPDFEELAGLHGFNAHDYRAEDLARFFVAADAARVTLLPEERRLLELLVASGVLARVDDLVRAGSGGVLSISRSSTEELRLRFLTHEALHGLYFGSARFRAGAAAAWEQASDELKQFFLLYLSWPDWSYDLSNPYLLVNEFMAYLLQYTEEEVASALFERGTTWLAERFPDRRPWLDRFGKDGLAQILDAYRDLQYLLRREIGAGGGKLAGLRRIR